MEGEHAPHAAVGEFRIAQQAGAVGEAEELGQMDEGMASLRAAVQAGPHNYGSALRMLITAGRGRFWLRRSAAAACLGFDGEP